MNVEELAALPGMTCLVDWARLPINGHVSLPDEFELPEQARADRHEYHALFAIGINVR